MYNEEYQIVMKDNHLVLEQKINQMISDGWKPQGGLSVVSGELFTANFFQAMIRNKHLNNAITRLQEETLKR